MKKFFLFLIALTAFVSHVFGTTYVPLTKEQAIKMGFVKEVNIQDEAEKLIGPQICFWYKTNDKIGFIMIFGSSPSKDMRADCIKVVQSVVSIYNDTFSK